MSSRLRARGDPSLSVPLLANGMPGGRLRTVRLGIRLGITSSNGAIPVDRCGCLFYAMVITGSSSTCGINNVSSITSVLRPTVAKQ